MAIGVQWRGKRDRETNDVDGNNLAVEVDVKTLEKPKSYTKSLRLSAELVFSQCSGDSVRNHDSTSGVEVR
jgi:hypothetical protein